MTAGKKKKTRLDGDDVAAIPGGTTNGPVLDVRNVKTLEENELEISIPSFVNLANTSYLDGWQHDECTRYVSYHIIGPDA